jgi:hypothetical protein
MPVGYNKFHAQRTTTHGRTFDSRGEAQCFEFLTHLQNAGEISGLRHQKYVDLVAGIRYKADYYFVDTKTGEEIWGEYKGFETPEWRLKLKLWKVFGPGRLRIFRGHNPRYSVEDVLPQPLSCPKCQSRFDSQA